jgi:hypothetical protein
MITRLHETSSKATFQSTTSPLHTRPVNERKKNREEASQEPGQTGETRMAEGQVDIPFDQQPYSSQPLY